MEMASRSPLTPAAMTALSLPSLPQSKIFVLFIAAASSLTGGDEMLTKYFVTQGNVVIRLIDIVS